MAEKKKFYAVVKGRKPGIYSEWFGEAGAEAQIRGFNGALYRGFTSRQDAEAFLESGGVFVPPAFSDDAQSAEAAPDYQAELLAGRVVIFTDGASSGNPGPGGYGVVLLFGNQRRELSAGFRCTTNNRMEILACIAGLEVLKRKSKVTLYSDSRYVVHSIQLGWARRWRSHNWMRAPDSHGEVHSAENVDLWKRLLELLDSHEVTCYWVKGHASHAENERCDRLAVTAARADNLPEDPGFEAAQCKDKN